MLNKKVIFIILAIIIVFLSIFISAQTNEKDTTPPVIKLKGANPQKITVGTDYTELGATVTDDVDEDLEAEIDSSDVDVDTIGTYEVTYNAEDSAGNKAKEVIRKVQIVAAGEDVTPIDGDDDDEEPNDNDGNTNPIITSDTTRPIIYFIGSNVIYVEINTTFTDPGAYAKDDKSLTVTMKVTGTVDTTKVGTYKLTYYAWDAAGNQASTIRTVHVIDTKAPVITLTGANPQVVELGTAYAELGATVTDNSGKTIIPTIDATSVDATKVGTYYVTYNATDGYNAAAQVVRTVNVLDTKGPLVTFGGVVWNGLNNSTANIEVNATDATGIQELKYVWTKDNVQPTTGFTVFNNGDTLSKKIDKDVNYLWVFATDTLAHQTVASTSVHYTDLTAPEITVLGDNPYSQQLGATFTDPGATAYDDYDLDVTSSIVATGTVNTNVTGTYTVTYTASDSSGNTATATRTVIVEDTAGPEVNFGPVTWSGPHNGTANIQVTVTDPSGLGTLTYVWTKDPVEPTTGFTTFNSGDTLTQKMNKHVKYLWIFALDALGNASVEYTDVHFTDTTAPEITVLGDNPYYQELGKTYTDPGATAEDNYDLDVTSSIIVTGTVDTDTEGTYTITYTVSDDSGNTATATRTVIVSDTTGPEIHFSDITWTGPHSSTANIVVTVTDPSELSSLTYVWTKDPVEPTSGFTAFNSGDTLTQKISKHVKYLWIFASDTLGHSVVDYMDVHYTDTTDPVVTFSSIRWDGAGNKTANVTVTATDLSTISTLKYVWTTVDVEPSFTGAPDLTNGGTLSKSTSGNQYYLWILAVDEYGNSKVSKLSVKK